jgi:hypothetical protein
MNSFLEKQIGNKEIVIYGTGDVGKHFFERWGTEWNILHCTSSYDSDCEIEGTSFRQLEQLDKSEHFLVICSESYTAIREHLDVFGWNPIENFTYYLFFEEVVIRKKHVMLGLGACKIDEIGYVLKKNHNFSDFYHFCFFSEFEVFETGERFKLSAMKEFIATIKMADVFLHSPAIELKRQQQYKMAKAYLKSNVREITISLFNFDSYWPQDISDEREVSKYYIIHPNEPVKAYQDRDQVVEKMVEGNMPPKDILKIIKQKNFFDEDVVWNNHKKCLAKIKLIDRYADIRMMEYVYENYALRKLYIDRGHFNDEIIREYAHRIWSYLGIGDDAAVIEKFSMEFDMPYNEFPIYPSTADILNLEWINQDTLYRMVGFNGLKHVSFEEYMECLIEYYYHAKEIIERL